MALWLTYAWVDNEDGDFDYIAQELRGFGVDTIYDKVAIVPGQRLWSQIANHISDPNTQGWAFLITPSSLESEPCLEELAYALDRALRSINANFPLIGLVTQGVSYEDVPLPLKVRLCVNLATPNWKEQVQAALEARPPQLPNSTTTKYHYKISQEYNGAGALLTTIEIRPRFGELHFWRVIVPASCHVIEYGVGPAGTGQRTGLLHNSVEGQGKLSDGTDSLIYGSSDPLTPGTSAIIKIDNGTPDFLGFGLATEPFGMSLDEMELQKLK
jgi:hypothetical protein